MPIRDGRWVHDFRLAEYDERKRLEREAAAAIASAASAASEVIAKTTRTIKTKAAPAVRLRELLDADQAQSAAADAAGVERAGVGGENGGADAGLGDQLVDVLTSGTDAPPTLPSIADLFDGAKT